MKRQPRVVLAAGDRLPAAFDLRELEEVFDRPGVAAVYLFGSRARQSAHPLSDVDLAYLGIDSGTENRLFDLLYEALQRLLGEGNFDLIPLRRAPLHLQFHVATEGILLSARDPIVAESFAARAIVRYLDFKPYRDAYFAGD